jgi:hypothetical protein
MSRRVLRLNGVNSVNLPDILAGDIPKAYLIGFPMELPMNTLGSSATNWGGYCI